ncbi:cytochrome P450 [Chitinophaga sp. G-6-1-13]|uniref:Cytochrome P450 n=1 Tax=Chitinophaga fulva TaxID=2728842 RepID=A0A848GPE2_9BACT|nr:cytochrome P450 [Chitinophaga fulva]NML40274.1 cytochrome P450 [Chitinophaga fulva]
MPTHPNNIHFDADFPLMDGKVGAWQFYRYADVKTMLYDYKTYSNIYMPENGMLGANMNQTDPPLHTTLRAIVSPYFSRQAIKSIEPFIIAQCNRLLDLLPQNDINFVRDVTFPLSASVIGHILGIPEQFHSKIDEWAKVIVTAGYVENGVSMAAQAQKEMAALFVDLMAEQNKSTTLLSALSGDQSNLPALTSESKLGNAMTILLAGYETTASLLNNTIYELAKDNILQTIIRGNPEKTGQAILEVLRLRPSLTSMYRRVEKETTISGVLIPTGDIVNGWISIANRDESVFVNPDYLDLSRHNSNQALSFGYGIHHCIGAILAQAETQILTTQLLSRSVNVTLIDQKTPPQSPSIITPTFLNLPMNVQWR